jgi:outer membrane protein insertion porin family
MVALKKGALYSDAQLQLDINNILNNYNKSGYFEARITEIKKDFSFDSAGVDLYIKIDEGSQTLIGELIIDGNKIFSDRYIQNIIETKPGNVFDQSLLNSDMSDLLTLYETKGFPFASITVDDIEKYSQGNSNKLRIKIHIDENELVKINRIVIEGNTNTKDEVITREINLGKNKSITKENLLEIQNRLENLGYFETVDRPKYLNTKTKQYCSLKLKKEIQIPLTEFWAMFRQPK